HPSNFGTNTDETIFAFTDVGTYFSPSLWPLRAPPRHQGALAGRRTWRLALCEDDPRKHAARADRHRDRPIVGETNHHVKANGRLAIKTRRIGIAPISRSPPRAFTRDESCTCALPSPPMSLGRPLVGCFGDRDAHDRN